ncbi:LOW QUALITY PROTEIN: Signal recognition particle subunit SRP68 [Paramyrothecium foliicola]|nr:LOW QUALITY PROTEIN: Signal recognition particle subunit SRP68 [Paramyrothecium foliicola]
MWPLSHITLWLTVSDFFMNVGTHRDGSAPPLPIVIPTRYRTADRSTDDLSRPIVIPLVNPVYSPVGNLRRHTMDITKTVVQGRDKALLYGDYSTYHSQLTKRLANSRKKLAISTKNRGKFQKRDAATAEDVGSNHEYVHLLLLTSERAWAQAMSIKSAHSSDQKGIVGRTRSHIVSRLEKAARAAELLASLLAQPASGASANDLLEAKAYAALIRGTMQFEKHSWEPCLQSYSVTRVVYSALATSAKGDIFKDLLSETIDPSIRYAAYQLKTPRTVPIPVIARKAFPQSDESLVREINRIDPNILSQGDADSRKALPGAESAPRTLNWRSRVVQIEDAQIAIAWGIVKGATARLEESLANLKNRDSHEVAGAYDEILTATQDTVDATKQAIDELREEGVGQGDASMQSLQITRTAVNYEMISWRVGRNRVLTGPHDGATEEYGSLRRKKRAKTGPTAAEQAKELPPSRKLAKLKEKVALYEGILQNLESIKELPGVAADEELATKIDGYDKYFEALKSLAIARSHAIVGQVANALGLIHHSSKLCREAASKLQKSDGAEQTGPLNVEVGAGAVAFLSNLLNGELQRHRAIVHIDNLRKSGEGELSAKGGLPLIERLHEYPAGGVDFSNLVEFPPKLALIPLKPIFLDVAWNYINYPGKEQEAVPQPQPSANAPRQPEQPAQPQKRGWFGFGRS